MGRAYRDIRLVYNGTDTTIQVRSEWETVDRQDIEEIRETRDGSRYKYKTGDNKTFNYRFSFSDKDLFDFFNDAYLFDGDIQFFRETETPGVFENYTVIIRQPQYNEDTIDSEDPVYSAVRVQVLTA